jgi:SPP1 gp7 family putative phage head morphogenesis protein
MNDKGHELTDKKLAELEKKLKAHYKQASDEVQKKLDDYLKAFKAKDARHLADLQKDFTKENYEEYIRWRQGQVLISERWEEMRQSLAEDYHNANVIARSIIDGYMPDIYALNHNYGTYDVEHNALVDTSYTLYDRQTVERLMRDDPDMLPPPGKKVSKRIAEGKDMLWNKSMIQSSMWQSITQGESMDKIAKRLAQTVGDKDMAAAVRNARTMTTGAECAGRVDSYKRAQSMGIHLQQEWMATLDGRTRHTHRQLHGERMDVGGTFSNGCRFPGDPSGPAEEVYNCRCTLVAAIKGFEGDKVTSSPKMGDMSYDEWVGEHEELTDYIELSKADDKSQNYRPVELDMTEMVTTQRNKEIKAYKAINTHNNIYVSENVDVKRKKLHQIDMNVSESLNRMNISEDRNIPNILVVSRDDMVNNSVAAYRAIENQLLVCEDVAVYKFDEMPKIMEQLACGNNDLSSYVHELYHWLDAEEFKNLYGSITKDNYGVYEEFINKNAKNRLDKLSEKGYNVLVSKYAKDSVISQQFCEVYTEFRTFSLLGGE